jgi:leucyl/phenylalanyl-tRNA--protein transferase
VLIPSEVIVSSSLWRSMGRFSVSVDTVFAEVVAGCADPRRPHGWITADYVTAYDVMHEAGYAHSIEVWDDSSDLAGGLLCVEVGGLVAAESKFHRSTDASKVAVVALCGLLQAAGPGRIIDVQWWTEHLGTLGARELDRDAYLAWLDSVEDRKPALTGLGLGRRPARTLWSRGA